MKTRLPQVTEKSIERDEIHRLFCLSGWWCIKIDVLKGVKIEYSRNGKTSVRRFTDYSAEEGRADLLATRMFRDHSSKTMFRPGVGEVLFVEVKRPGKSSEPHQTAWAEVRRKEGFIVLSDCRSWADVVEKARAAGIEVERAR